MNWKRLLTAPFILVLLCLTSCVIPIPIVIPIPGAKEDPIYVQGGKEEDPAHYAARIEPPARYDHPYAGPVVERVVPEAEVRSLCMSMGADAIGVACSWQSNGTCHIVLPSDGRPPVEAFRRHEIAHCNGWPADHPRDG